MKKWIAALATLVLAGSVMAQPLPPVNGLYNSPDQATGGQVLTGRFSESWVGNVEGAFGNTLNAASWDGAMGTQWHIWCASAVSTALVSDTRDGAGTGEVVYRTSYADGRFWFARTGPWSADGLVDFPGDIQELIVTSTHQFVMGTRLGVRANITLSGIFDQQEPTWDPSCMDYVINNTSIMGNTDMGSFPADYPPLLDEAQCPSDAVGMTTGAWGSVTQITMLITGCVVPAEETTWGAIKTLYDN